MPGSEYLVGRNAVCEALRADRRRFDRVLIGDRVSDKGPIRRITALCRRMQVPVQRVKRQELDRLGRQLPHQGVAAQVSSYPLATLDDMLALARERQEPPFLLALDSLQDPQNVGSLLRTAEAVGVHGVVVPERRSVGITPAVSRASAGAVEHMRVAQVTNLARTIDELKESGLWVVGVEGHESARDYRQVDLNMPLALVLGSEGLGMRRLIRDKCDLLLRIPMLGHVTSLNVAIAGSLILYQALCARQGYGIQSK